MKQSASSNRVIEPIVDGFPALAQPAPHGRTKGQIGVRFKRLLELNSTRMRAAQIEVMIADLDSSAKALEGAIKAEQDKTGIHDPAHFAYSTCAKAMTQRHDNLNHSIDKLKRQLADAKLALE
jgi:flagellar protein FliJ